MKSEQLDFFEETLPDKESAELNYTDQKIHFLALSSIRGIGFNTLRKIYARHRRFDSVWKFSETELHQFIPNSSRKEIDNTVNTLRTKRESLINKAEESLNNYLNRNIDIQFLFEPGFPKVLSEIPDPPYWLFIEGNRTLLTQDNLIAIVGNRAATLKGLDTARRLSSVLSTYHFPIVSGLAEGIDAVAQQTAIDYGNKCIAVLGTGISVVFPSTTAGLRNSIVKYGGVIISEYLPNDSYTKSRFVQRNRLQAAISRIVIPVEWAIKGGTTHTIRYAEKYKKTVVFVRGLVGNNIDENASLYTSINNRYIIDIESSSIEKEIKTMLQSLKINIPINELADSESRPIFKSVADEFARLVEQYDVSEFEYNNFLDELRRRWKKQK